MVKIMKATSYILTLSLLCVISVNAESPIARNILPQSIADMFEEFTSKMKPKSGVRQ